MGQRGTVSEGLHLVESVLAQGQAGLHQVQSAHYSVYCAAESLGETDRQRLFNPTMHSFTSNQPWLSA